MCQGPAYIQWLRAWRCRSFNSCMGFGIFYSRSMCRRMTSDILELREIDSILSWFTRTRSGWFMTRTRSTRWSSKLYPSTLKQDLRTILSLLVMRSFGTQLMLHMCETRRWQHPSTISTSLLMWQDSVWSNHQFLYVVFPISFKKTKYPAIGFAH